MYHALSTKDTLKKLNTSIRGLSESEAKRRLEKFGFNELIKKKKINLLKIIYRQFSDVFVLLLIFAMIVSAIFSDVDDAILIGIIVILNSVIGTVQDYKAEKAVEALKSYLSPKAKVIRNGKLKTIDAKFLVPGDIVVIDEGDRIPADGRLLKAVELKIDESVLTGESTPVSKSVAKLPFKISITEMKDMVFSGTYIIRGRGIFVVTETGSKTQIGKIAKMTAEIREGKSPLKKRLGRFAKKLALAIIVITLAIFFVEVLRAIIAGDLTLFNVVSFFMIAIALAVSAVPEGLPAAVTIALSLGAKDMVKRKALIRKLSSVETLGSVDILCVDKTGTLTKGEMTITKIWVNNKEIDVTGTGYEPNGKFLYKKKEYKGKDIESLLLAGSLANDSQLEYEGKWRVIGDPTEGSIIVAAKKYGLDYNYKRIKEFPFSSERMMMSSVNIVKGKKYMFTKGAVEVILEKSKKILKDGKEIKLTKEDKQKILRMNKKFADNALRVLAIGYKKLNNYKEKDFTFIGLVGMIDPPREETYSAYKKCTAAGIKTVMITGDHKLTAVAIAKQIGIYKGGKVLTGDELSTIKDGELDKIIEDVEVFARVLPEQKLKIVKSLQRKNHIVGMTGDGVNDAPALKQADIGIAVNSGTDVAKEASDMILLDDNYATIVSAVEKGREVYANIRKFSFFLMRCNFDEVAIVATFSIVGMPIPFTAPMILWENLVTDGGPAISLAVDPMNDNLMDKPPRKLSESLLKGYWPMIIVSFISQYFSSFILFLIALWMTGWNLAVSRTMVFTEATIRELVVVWNSRSETKGIFRLNPLSNKWLFLSVITSALGTVFVVAIPSVIIAFGGAPLTLAQWLISLAFSSIGIIVMPELFYGKKLPKFLDKIFIRKRASS